MRLKSAIYKGLKYSNDVNAVLKHTSENKKIQRRIGRRVYGKITGRLARKLFG